MRTIGGNAGTKMDRSPGRVRTAIARRVWNAGSRNRARRFWRSCGARQTVADACPLGSIRRQLNRDPVVALLVEFVQNPVEALGVRRGVARHSGEIEAAPAAFQRRLAENNRRSRAVVARMLAWRFGAPTDFHRPDQLFDLSLGDHARPKYPSGRSGQRDYRTFYPDCARSAVEHQIRRDLPGRFPQWWERVR